MRKSQELSDPNSCINRSAPEEMVFVLTSRDAAAPHAIRAWVDERLRLGKNVPGDPQIVEALECAATMEREGRVPNALRHVGQDAEPRTDWQQRVYDEIDRER